ncbi:MAG TPA: FecR family protein, partial [Blastocatellia bacterium]|nr:FecR family protein [Blastocatellia bacterium]
MNSLASQLVCRSRFALVPIKTLLAIALLALVSFSQATTETVADSPDKSHMQFRCLTRGGMINSVEGEVFARIGKKDWRNAAVRIELRNGDGLKTGPNSRAELLLNPGSFLRVSENTEIVYTDTSVNNLKLKLVKGTAIIEVAVNDRWGFIETVYSLITVATPKAEFAILPGGIYRFRVDEGGGAEVMVRKGRVVASGAIIREGRRASVSNGPPYVAPFDKDEMDGFDQWSKDRAKLLVQANKLMKEEKWYEELDKGKRAVFVEERSTLPQNIKNQYVVSAKAGAVIHVEGASFKRGEEDWSTLAAGYDLRDGDQVKIDEESRAEILLTPDSYLRLSGGARFKFSDTSPESISFELASGSAIIESSEDRESSGAEIRVGTPHGEYLVASDGVYRFDIELAGRSEVMVRRGQLRTAGLTVKEGKKVVFDGASPKVVEFDRDAQDSLDIWSRHRAG